MMTIREESEVLKKLEKHMERMTKFENEHDIAEMEPNDRAEWNYLLGFKTALKWVLLTK